MNVSQCCGSITSYVNAYSGIGRYVIPTRENYLFLLDMDERTISLQSYVHIKYSQEPFFSFLNEYFQFP